MSLLKSIGLHVALVGVATVTAISQWTKDEEPVQAAAAQVKVWSGSPDQVQSVSYDGEGVKVRLEPKKDELGRYYIVHLNKLEKKSAAPMNPHAPPPKPSKDEGKWVKSNFISVTEGNTLVDALAPLQALRAIGRVDKDREEEFGFDKPEGKLKVKISGTEHQLVVGGLTPGGGDRYVRLSGSNEAYAVPGEALRGFFHPESRLLETRLHAFDMDEVKRLKVTRGKDSRELIKVAGKANGWASLDKPLEEDETASNWMTKVSRLRIGKYLQDPPKKLGPDSLVVRIEYFDSKDSLGFLELFKLAEEPGSKEDATYLVHTEHTRWYADVLSSAAEQVERDAPSVLESSNASQK